MLNLCASEKRTSGNDLLSLYSVAEEEGVPVDYFQLQKREALSIMDTADRSCSIAIDPLRLTGPRDEKMKLAHELGHCMTGSFYNPYTPLDVRAQHETRANRWAYRQLVPTEVLLDAVQSGCRNMWELAEYLDLPEDFLTDALDYYKMLAQMA